MAQRIDKIFSTQKTLWTLIAVSIPFSFKLYTPIIDLELVFPAEILIGLAMVLFIASMFVPAHRPKFHKSFFKHPITILIIAHVLLSILATIFSYMPLVSVKATIVQVTFIGVFYFAFSSFLLRYNDGALKVLSWHVYAFILVALFVVIVSSNAGLNRISSLNAAYPFYVDHTIYAAALTFVLFFFSYLVVRTFRRNGRSPKTLFLFVLFLFCCWAFLLSYCRGAWLAILATIPFILYMLNRKLLLVLSVICVALVALWLNTGRSSDLPFLSNSNANDHNAGIWDVFSSITNTSSDPSNAERVERWGHAIEMFKERPYLGFGPGTYQFKYLEFLPELQRKSLSTTGPSDPNKISTEWRWSNDLMVRSSGQFHLQSSGTAHSEYLLLLATSGPLAMLIFMFIGGAAIIIGMRNIKRAKGLEERTLIFSTTLALVAYGVHAVFNNFLDDPKIAMLFWTGIAIITNAHLQLEAPLNAKR